MFAYLCLAIGGLWLALAILLRNYGFAIEAREGVLNPATILIIFRIGIPIFLFGWVVPTALGFWLLWKGHI